MYCSHLKRRNLMYGSGCAYLKQLMQTNRLRGVTTTAEVPFQGRVWLDGLRGGEGVQLGFFLELHGEVCSAGVLELSKEDAAGGFWQPHRVYFVHLHVLAGLK